MAQKGRKEGSCVKLNFLKYIGIIAFILIKSVTLQKVGNSQERYGSTKLFSIATPFFHQQWISLRVTRTKEEIIAHDESERAIYLLTNKKLKRIRNIGLDTSVLVRTYKLNEKKKTIVFREENLKKERARYKKEKNH